MHPDDSALCLFSGCYLLYPGSWARTPGILVSVFVPAHDGKASFLATFRQRRTNLVSLFLMILKLIPRSLEQRLDWHGRSIFCFHLRRSWNEKAVIVLTGEACPTSRIHFHSPRTEFVQSTLSVSGLFLSCIFSQASEHCLDNRARQ